MKITLLGTGTSQGIPVIGCTCATCTSVNPHDKRLRCSALITTDEGLSILIDTSPDLRQQMLTYNVEMVDAVLYTHEHNDHIAGLDDIRPFNFKAKKHMPVYGEQRVIDDIRLRFAYVFEHHAYPGAPRVQTNVITAYQPFTLGATAIMPLRVWHADLPILGYKIGKIAYLTDVKSLDQKTLDLLQDIDLLIISALRDQPHHSHITVEDAIGLANSTSAKSTYLIHMSHDLGTVETWGSKLPKGIFAGYDGLTVSV